MKPDTEGRWQRGRQFALKSQLHRARKALRRVNHQIDHQDAAAGRGLKALPCKFGDRLPDALRHGILNPGPGVEHAIDGREADTGLTRDFLQGEWVFHRGMARDRRGGPSAV
ncbi:hypothetical protein AA103196_1928 [Ameyamaea chiangmaiensis NBRC 103196]|nr:hypothetical protein AA103196_1928 [Ameyamaea chiangmaiensis NBRC 103196]